jgi:hypothetical protein
MRSDDAGAPQGRNHPDRMDVLCREGAIIGGSGCVAAPLSPERCALGAPAPSREHVGGEGLGAAAAVVQRVAHRAAELAHALRESFVRVAAPVLEQLDQGKHLACVANFDRSARAGSGHLRGDWVRRWRLQGARLQLLADTPGNFNLAAADREMDPVQPFGHSG